MDTRHNLTGAGAFAPPRTGLQAIARLWPSWLGTLRAQVGLAMSALFLLLATSVGATWYELDLRKHDYIILNLAGQLRVTSQSMVHQAADYLKDTPTSYGAYYRDLRLYYEDLKRQASLYNRIVTSFEARELGSDLTGKNDKITCTWDSASRLQLSRTAGIWHRFHSGLLEKLGDDPDGPRLNWGAEYIVANGPELVAASDQLTGAFQVMMEEKLNGIRRLNEAVLVLAGLLMAGLLILLYRNLVRPLRHTMAGFARVARGDLGHQVPVLHDDEIGQMTRAFNQLSERLHSLFRLTDRIGQGKTLDDSLRFVAEEFRGFLPVDWVGLFFRSADGSRWVLERQHGAGSLLLRPHAEFAATGETASDDPLILDDLGRGNPLANELVKDLQQIGLGAATLLPMTGSAQSRALLVIAARPARSYTPEHVEFLANVAGQITHALDKTVFLENLVVAAVQGLAKLAESRDPETGDHLLRMSRYAAIVAEELGRQDEFRDRITAAYVREVFQFAPMHDIGKVGIADGILLKPGRLDETERRDMERHPLIGAEVLRRCESQVNALGYSIFRVAIEIAEGHHEKFDGSGYPLGLRGQAIPLSARIVAVADVFDALTSRRPYKEAWPVERALDLLRAESGRHFDPQIVDAFLHALPQIRAIYDQHRHV